MFAIEQYSDWIHYDNILPEIKEELEKISNNHEEIHDRFYRDMEFGTGGLRGVIGVGTQTG